MQPYKEVIPGAFLVIPCAVLTVVEYKSVIWKDVMTRDSDLVWMKVCGFNNSAV